MKTMGLILIVVALHCAIIGSVFFISGCGTTPKTESATVTPVMPSPKPPQAQPEVLPAAPAPVKEIKTAGGGEYIVQAGDSLSVIAKRCHVTQTELIEANKLADPNKLKVGQKLILPASGYMPVAAPKSTVKAKVKSETAKAAASEAVQAGANEYVVKAGDNLSKIAAHCGVKVSALREVNKLRSDKIKIGQKLMIPEAKKTVTAEFAAADVGSRVEAPVAPVAAAALPAVTDVKGAAAVPAVNAPAAATVASSSGIVHVVQPNDDLNSIAKLYAVTVEEIVEFNQLSTNRTVQVGQRLKIP